jgi:formate--tetrahydrofolate ligase
VVIVATVRALKHHGGCPKRQLGAEGLDYLEKGIPNLLHHIENITVRFGLPAVVAINRFPTDTEAELSFIEAQCRKYGANVALSEVWGRGGEGGEALAREVVRLAESGSAKFSFIYDDASSLEEKIDAIVQKVYGGDGADFSAAAKSQLAKLTALGYGHLPVCMAKTQYSFSDNPALLGWPKGFRVAVRGVKVSAGAGFVVALTGEIMTMPGLPKVPAAEKIDVDSDGKISGLF